MPGIFGGNGSVQWSVDVDNGRGALDDLDTGGGKHHHKGIDDTPAGGGGNFTITILVPKNQAAWTTLKSQLNAATTAALEFKLTLPIEDRRHGGPNPYQIQIDWA